MTDTTVEFIKGSDNPIQVTLTEDDAPIAITWTSIAIKIGDPAVVTINRSDESDGVEFAGGILTIIPADLTESVDGLVDGSLHPLWVQVADAGNADGFDFGGETDGDHVNVLVRSRP